MLLCTQIQVTLNWGIVFKVEKINSAEYSFLWNGKNSKEKFPWTYVQKIGPWAL
jgi:hypothetical protein